MHTLAPSTFAGRIFSLRFCAVDTQPSAHSPSRFPHPPVFSRKVTYFSLTPSRNLRSVANSFLLLTEDHLYVVFKLLSIFAVFCALSSFGQAAKHAEHEGERRSLSYFGNQFCTYVGGGTNWVVPPECQTRDGMTESECSAVQKLWATKWAYCWFVLQWIT